MKEKRENLIQAYSLTPWRGQLQLIVWFSAVVIGLALVAGVYLNVTARAATVGREIQFLQYQILDLQRENADLENQLASLPSVSAMEQRAKEMGFQAVPPQQLVYIEVPGYAGRQEVVMAPPPVPVVSYADQLPPEFTQTLFEWVQAFSMNPGDAMVQVLP